MIAEDKLKAEGGLAKTKVILGWHFNFCTLTVTLSDHKYIAWSSKIKQMIIARTTTKKTLEATSGRLGHVGFVIPWVYHFLNRLGTLLTRSQNRRVIKINSECKHNL